MWRYGQNGMGAALGEVNSGVALGGRWDGSMGQQHGTTRRRKLTSGIALCSNLLDPHACPYPALLEECVTFSAACGSPLLRESRSLPRSAHCE